MPSRPSDASPGRGLPRRARALAQASLALVAACGSEPPTIPEPDLVGRVVLSPSDLTGAAALLPGDTVRIRTEVFDSTGRPMDGVTIRWTTSDASRVTVDASGLVRAVSGGTAHVTATAGSRIEQVNVSVLPVIATMTAVNPSPGFVPGGRYVPAFAMTDPAGDTIPQRPVTFGSSAPAIVAVSGVGEVSALAVGSAALTATREGRTADLSASVTAVRFASLSVGATHACGLTAAGDAYCWGGWPGDRLGVLGTGVAGPVAPAPARVAGGYRFLSLSAGWDHTCGVTTEGVALCWGDDDPVSTRYKLGGEPLPAPVRQGTGFATVATGWNYACGTRTDQRVYCWGSNTEGQLGRYIAIPSPGDSTARPVESGELFTAVSAASGPTGPTGNDLRIRARACARTPDDRAFCWAGGSPEAPTPVAGDLRFAQVEAGVAETCGVTTDGAAYCWVASEAPAQVGAERRWREVRHRIGQRCGVAEDGTAYCWPASGGAEQAVGGGRAYLTVQAGEGFACGLATDGRAYCWGENGLGQLGDGTTTDRAGATPVLGQE